MNPLPPDQPSDPPLYLNPEDRCLREYIQSEPDVKFAVNAIARDCIRQVKKMGLSFKHEETREAIRTSLNFHEIFTYNPTPAYQDVYGDKEIARFRYLTGLDAYGEQISEEEKEATRQMLQSISESDLSEIPGLLQRSFSRKTEDIIKNAKAASKGCDGDAKVALMTYSVKKLMEPAAIILREAASLAALDPECMDGIREGIFEDLTPRKFSQTAHTRLVADMSTLFSYVVEDEILSIGQKEHSLQKSRSALEWVFREDDDLTP